MNARFTTRANIKCEHKSDVLEGDIILHWYNCRFMNSYRIGFSIIFCQRSRDTLIYVVLAKINYFSKNVDILNVEDFRSEKVETTILPSELTV